MRSSTVAISGHGHLLSVWSTSELMTALLMESALDRYIANTYSSIPYNGGSA